jgi:GH24 family phage-related lysozyme (muramidase)
LAVRGALSGKALPEPQVAYGDVGSGDTDPNAAFSAADAQSDAASQPPRLVSPQGRAYIIGRELDRRGQPILQIQKDDYGNLTFGYGHKVMPSELADLQQKLAGMSPDQRSQLAWQTYLSDEAAARQRVYNAIGSDIANRLTPNQFDALAISTFNAGRNSAVGPNMASALRQGDMAAAQRQFNAWRVKDHRTGQWVNSPGLVRRNLQAGAIFGRGDYNYEPPRSLINSIANPAQPAQ